MKRFALISVLAAWMSSIAVAGPDPEVPKNAVEYKRDGYTQSIFTLNDRPAIRYVKVSDLTDKDWHQSGGMLGIEHTSRKFKTIPAKSQVKTDLAKIPVFNGSNDQYELGIVREYPNGTRFDDVLYYKDKIFEHRVREKVDGEWKNKIAFADKELRPPGYKGLKQSCSSCHDRTGTGGYAEGLVPGGDGVFSDPLDWTLLERR